MKRAFLFLTILCLATLCRADEQTLQVQQALKDQGFYYAAVDGNPGPETDAAIRRYQIRQGLDVTGKLDAQTLASLNLGGSAQGSGDADQPTPAPEAQPADQQPTPTPSQVQGDQNFLKSQQDQPDATPPPPPPSDDQDTAPTPAAPPPGAPVAPIQPFEPQAPPQQPGPPPGLARAPLPEYSDFFRKTPYATAPAVVQQGTVRSAQARLGRQGFYRGYADGTLSKSFSHAISAYQYDTDLKVSGRLDMETLASLNLLPRRRVIAGPPPDEQPVYRGVWVH
jgi:peptidoglycan hydrolase-like protein with peptidoglycan-binding domain